VVDVDLHTERKAREDAKEFPREYGTGANEFQYYVSNNLGDSTFVKLPDVLPGHIRHARKLRKLLTGSLHSEVSTYPPFPWNEAAYLRAQIARIAATTVLAPNGWFSQEEDDEGKVLIVQSEELESVSIPEDDKDAWLANWVHRCAVYQHLTKSSSVKIARYEAMSCSGACTVVSLLHFQLGNELRLHT
jgi:radial spoke head protein 4/6